MTELPQTQQSLQLIQAKQMKLVFKHMSELGPQYLNYDALAWMNSQGDVIIVVNEVHRHAPADALAALISHEAMHNDRYNSLQEEVTAWNHEASVWGAYVKQNPSLSTLPHPLVKRLNTLLQKQSHGEIRQLVHQHPNYQTLPRVSPGFDVAEGSIAPSPSQRLTMAPTAEPAAKKEGIPNPLTLSLYPDAVTSTTALRAFPFAQESLALAQQAQQPQQKRTSAPTPTVTSASGGMLNPSVAMGSVPLPQGSQKQSTPLASPPTAQALARALVQQGGGKSASGSTQPLLAHARLGLNAGAKNLVANPLGYTRLSEARISPLRIAQAKAWAEAHRAKQTQVAQNITASKEKRG
jgi:hypothetical protein